MKTRFNTYDIICGVTELHKLVGMRVNQIYDIDNKTYLIRLQQSEAKWVLLLESGTRFHTTNFEWPKNMAPSGFTMKLRKHLKNKRLEKVEQFGVDRIVGFQFGTDEAAYHVILELYDRGNIILADHELTILNILRPHTEGEVVRFAVRERYPSNRAKQYDGRIGEETLREAIEKGKPGDSLRRILTPALDCGPAVIDHILHKHGLENCAIPGAAKTEEEPPDNQTKKNRKQRKKDGEMSNARPYDPETDFPRLIAALNEADEIIKTARSAPSKGYIIQKKEAKPTQEDTGEEFFYQNIEYHPALFFHHKNQPYKEFETFLGAVDEFYSTLEGQKIDVKAMHQEREALKKLSNVKKDHAKRLEELGKAQEVDKQKAELITRNQKLVDDALFAMRSAIANQMSWADIQELVKAAQTNGDPVARTIKQLKLEINHVSLLLHDPYRGYEEENDELENDNDDFLPSMLVDIDLGLSAFANARKYYDQKRYAAKKEQRTIDASEKALKSAEKKTQQTLKEVRTISTISKARKIYWFEKFYWFISSENYLIIGGRDGQQNELIVKRYMRPTDIYVHAEIQGATSVIIRNPTGNDVPPKTLLEAGTMAISYSVAWDAKVVTNAYWVKSEQVSKTAPTGEYLTTGSFMIRGKKNFLPPCHLIMGLSLLFKLEDSSIERHRDERRVRTFDEEAALDKMDQLEIENEKLDSVQEEDIELDNDSDNPETGEKSEKANASNATSDDDSDSDNAGQFPDTHIKVEHDTGKITLQSDRKLESLSSVQEETKHVSESAKSNELEEEDAPYIISSLPPRRKQQSASKKKKQDRERRAADHHKQQQQQFDDDDDKKSTQVKRGQRGKMKKIKSKYRDQDEEERQMRMEILKSAGSNKAKEMAGTKQEEDSRFKNPKKITDSSKRQQQEDAEDLDDTPANADVEMLDSLTGQPLDEDELLFAIPVVAPYQTLQNYKYKVKLTPGTGKRGKAAKMALLMFSKDRTCTLREKDLLKGVKEESLARNIPGKVKLSAPQLQKFKK